LEHDSNIIWMREALLVLAAMLFSTLLWFAMGPAWAAGAGSSCAILLIWRQLANAVALRRWLRNPQQTFPDGSGVWEGAFGELYRLVKSLRREQERLSAAMTRFRSAGTAMPDAVVILDVSNHIEWCNPMAERFLGIDVGKDAGQPILNLVRAPDFAEYLQHGSFGEPLILRTMRGDELTLSIQVIPYGQDEKLLFCRDITQAERLDTMRRDFVANVSHELKTPLTVVNGFLETLLDAKVKFTESREREVFGLMQQQTDRMLRLVEDLLTLSALESSPGLSGETEIDIGAMLHSLLEDGRALSAGRHRLLLETGPRTVVLGSDSELRSAFGNLVANAVHYTPRGGEIRLSWDIRESGDGEFAVSDSGVGIEASHIPRLTERFYRVDQSRSRGTGGTGLGLAIVKHVLTRHQATLEIDSEPGHGSRFVAILPARRMRVLKPSDQPAELKLAQS
jgi:two-component system phosphate regulon sensor histidine kinase PhoR